MKLLIGTLFLEVTRRCNMQCAHCLRGCSQCLDIPLKCIDRLFDKVEHIYSVTFTGGEPTLNLPAIEYFFKRAEELKKLPCNFYVVTNGMEYQLDLASLLLKWYPKMEEKDSCGVAISTDQFHENRDPDADVLCGLAFYSNINNNPGAIDNWVLSDRGLARENGIGLNTRPFHPTLCIEDVADDNVEIDSLYLSANGNIVGDCDLPYEAIDELSVCQLNQLKTYVRHIVKEKKRGAA